MSMPLSNPSLGINMPQTHSNNDIYHKVHFYIATNGNNNNIKRRAKVLALSIREKIIRCTWSYCLHNDLCGESRREHGLGAFSVGYKVPFEPLARDSCLFSGHVYSDMVHIYGI